MEPTTSRLTSRFQQARSRTQQIIFILSWLGLCWYGMMAVHELGHVTGALVTGGQVQQVVLHPATISRTDVSPNPRPLVVVWCGPILGCGLPLLIWRLLVRRGETLSQLAAFFAGFCLIANGAYVAIGSLDGIGDSGVMLSHGSPAWTLVGFGAVTFPSGMLVWHRMGSVREFLASPAQIKFGLAFGTFAALALALALQFSLSAF